MTHVKFNRRPLEKSFNSFVDDLFSELPVLYKNTQFGTGNRNVFVPVNILEKENGYAVEVVAPGFEKGDFNVNVDQNILTIAAEHKSKQQDEKDKHVRKEYNYRSFKRSFTLDEKINVSGIDAKYENGVLTLNLPYKDEVKTEAKEITIL